jgi:hypothetical protein
MRRSGKEESAKTVLRGGTVDEDVVPEHKSTQKSTVQHVYRLWTRGSASTIHTTPSIALAPRTTAVYCTTALRYHTCCCIA